jgi:hypothetical protein
LSGGGLITISFDTMEVWKWHWRPLTNDKGNSSQYDIEEKRQPHLHCTKHSAVQVWRLE